MRIFLTAHMLLKIKIVVCNSLKSAYKHNNLTVIIGQ